MIVLGLTGSIGMGKSTIAKMLETLLIPVHDADAEVHKLLGPMSPARPAFAANFPYFEYPEIYDKKTKNINRKALAQLVFSDKRLRHNLETILHPFVQKSQMDFIRTYKCKGKQIICLDIPLLFETNADKRVDYTINASAPFIVQEQRVLSRPNMTKEKFYAILGRQMPDTEKCTRADYVIHTGAGRAQTMTELKTILDDIRRKEHLVPAKGTKNKENDKRVAF